MDSLTEERMQVLRMIQEGKITAEDGAKLLAALKVSASRAYGGQVAGSDMPSAAGKWFRLRVTDMRSGKRKAIINIPLGLVDVGLKLGARFGTSNIDMNEVVTAIKSGATGKIVDIEDDAENERVEIYIE
jgi:hypothetical protein